MLEVFKYIFKSLTALPGFRYLNQCHWLSLIFVFFALASGNALAAANICLSLRRAAWGRAERADIQHYWALLLNKVVNLNLRNDLITVWLWNNTSGFIYKEHKHCKEPWPASTRDNSRSPAITHLRKNDSRRPRFIIRANLLAQGALSVPSPNF